MAPLRGIGFPERWGDLAAGVLDLLPQAALVVAGDGWVRGMNAAARGVLDADCGLVIDRDRLCHTSEEGSFELAARIRAAAAGVSNRRPLHLDGCSGPPLVVTVAPLTVDGTARAAVLINEARLPAPPSRDELIDRFGFTRAQSEVSRRLACGMAIDRIALDLDVTVQTVRGHLKDAFAKTGTHRQAELVALILSPENSLPL